MKSRAVLVLLVLQFSMAIEAPLEDLDKKVGSCVVGNPQVQTNLGKEQLLRTLLRMELPSTGRNSSTLVLVCQRLSSEREFTAD